MVFHDKKNVLREWRESAPYWAKHYGMIRSMFAPITTALIEAAAIKEGHSVLDVAGGSGEPSITIAQTFGLPTRVTCTDAVMEMLTAARREARHRRLTNIDFSECGAEALPFQANTFDVAVCRLGVMLFPDPAAAIGEMLRVVRPAGRVAFAVWDVLDSNPFFQVVTAIVSRYVESPPEDPDAPGAFRFAERGKLATLLSDAGMVQVTERVLKFTLEAPLTPLQYWEVRSELSDTLRTKVAGLSQQQVTRLAQEVEEAGKAFYEAGGMKFPASVFIVSGGKSDE
jgi:SAM-dependent methyltransferase